MTELGEQKQSDPFSVPKSLRQKRAALKLANTTRQERARIKQDLAAGRVRFKDVLADQPWELDTCLVITLLTAFPQIARVRAKQIMHAAMLSPDRTFARLTPHEVDSLLRAINERGLE